MDYIRTFIAVDIDKEAREKIKNLTRRFKSFSGKINFTDPDNLHITMNFLGDVESSKTVDVCQIVKTAAEKFEPFEFDIVGFQAVPKTGFLKMIWAGIEDTSGTLINIQDRLNREFAEQGFRAEKRNFNPHLTIARIKSTPEPKEIRHALEKLQQEHIASVYVEEIIAYTSQLTPQGPIYTPLTKCELG